MDSIQSILSTLTKTKRLERGLGSVMAAVHPGDPSIGTLSIPVGDPSILRQGEDWLRAQGCQRVWGPMEGCTWFSYRANLGPVETPLFFKEVEASPEPWVSSGYSQVAEYFSSQVDSRQVLERTSDRIQKAESLGWQIRSFDSDSLEEELRQCHRISHSAFQEALGYAPIPEKLFVGLYAPLLGQVPVELLLVASDESGRIGGYCLCFPDISAPESRRFVVKSLAIDPSAQRASLGTALLAAAHQRALAMGLDGGAIYALMHSDTHSIAISEKAGGVVFRRYGLFEKRL